VLAGGTCPASTVVLRPAIVASRSGRNRAYGNKSGSSSLVHWTSRVSWTGARPSWMAASFLPKRGRDIAYGWKGKGSTIHLLTEGHGLPLALLVTAANVAEVTVGLKVVDRVRVPGPRAVPSSVPPAWMPIRAMTALTSGMSCGDGGFNLPSPAGNGLNAAGSPAGVQRPMKPAGFAGRWNGVMAGWTTGGGWSPDMTGIPKAMSPF
jgi:hypothetical protein